MLKILTNKHMIIAMLVAPILAVITYLAVDKHVSEKPQAAQVGNSYKLAVKSNCRYQSGVCTLKNVDLEVTITAKRESASQILLSLESTRELIMSQIALFDGVSETPPQMLQQGSDGKIWTTTIDVAKPETSEFRMVAAVNDVYFYAEIPAVFVDYETSFSRENFVNE